MIIQIDRSGKLEKTNIMIVISFSNGISKAASISAAEKLKLKHYFRDIGKRKAYLYRFRQSKLPKMLQWWVMQDSNLRHAP